MGGAGAPRPCPARPGGHKLGPYRAFVAGLGDVQHALQDGLAEPDLPPPDARERAREYGLPPLDRNRFVAGPAFDTTLDRLFTGARSIDMPDTARAALASAAGTDPAARAAM